MRASDRPGARFGKPKVFDLTLLDQIFDGSGHVLYRHIRVNAVLIKQINRFNLESFERGFGDLFDVLWPAIQPGHTSLRRRIKLEPELGGDHHLTTERGEGFA